MKLKHLFAAALLLCSAGVWAQTNLIAGWDGGTSTASPSTFGWSSSTNRTLNSRNAGTGVRMMTTYSGYKLEDNSSYSYSSTSDPSSVIFWIRYGSSGESYTYTFQGLEADTYYDFSGLLGWHNNSNAPTFTVKINDGTSDLATISKYISTKQTLYAISSRFKTSSTITNTTDIKIVFTCNQTGDCMEAVSALKLVKVDVVLKDDLEAALSYANRVNATLSNSTLASAITTAQGVYDNASATQAQVNEAVSTLNTAAVTALASAAPTDMSFVINNPGFESSTAISANQSTNSSQDYASTGWTALSTSTSNSCGAVVAYGSSYTLNGATAPSADNNSASGNALGISVGWSTTVAYQSSAVTLPAGSYTMTVYGYNNNASGSNFTSKNGFITSSTNYLSTKTSFTNGTWETDVITFSLTEPTTGVFQIGGTAGGNTSTSHAKVFFDNITLTYADPLKASKDALQAEIEKASLCDAKEGLADAISTAEGILASATTIAELENALAALQAADKDAVLRYENGLADATALAPVVTSFVVNGTFDNNVDGWQHTASVWSNSTATNQQGAFNVPFYENWDASAKVNKMYQTIDNIPNGTYRLDIAAFVNTLANPNESQYVFANSDKTYLTTGDPTAYEVYTVVTNNQIEVGLEQTTATANWMGIDNVSLRYYGAGDVINDAKNAGHKLAWQEALAAAEAAVANSDYNNVTGSERAALNTEIAKAEPSTAEDYDAATAALTTATQTFVNAKTSYDLFAAYNTTLDYADPDKKPAITSESTAATIITALRAYFESNAMAEGVNDAENVTSLINNANNPTNNDGWTWSGNKNNPASNEPWTDADGTNNHSYFDGGNWGANTWTTTMSQNISLPAGTYLLTAKGRAATNTTLTMAVGEANVALPHVSSTGNVFDRGWGDASLEFTTDGHGIEIVVTASSETIHEWFSISDFRLVRLSLNTSVYADAADYAALNSAIEAAEAKTLGFEDGQYAPYSNVAALEALAAAKAIDQTAELTNFKTNVQAVTAALTAATWTANEGFVDAIYNGWFETPAEGQNYPEGWTRTNAWGQMQDSEIGHAYYNQPGSLQYGNQGVYTMPLAANTQYLLTFKYRSHENNSNKGMTVSVLNENNEGLAAVTFSGNGSTSKWKTVDVMFTTGAAGNYILTLANDGNTWMTDVSLLANTTSFYLNEDEDYEGINTDEEYWYADEAYYYEVDLFRTIKADTWNTFVVPFDLSNEELKAAFGDDVAVAEFSENSTDANDVTVNFDTMDTPAITANKPVLLKGDAGTDFSFTNKLIKTGEAKVSGTNVDFIGTYTAETTVALGDYFISGNKLWKSTGATTIKGTRAYIDAKNAAAVKMFIGGIATGIEAIDNGQLTMDNAPVFNLAGQRVNKAQKGIYIVNGKKVLVK